MRRVGQVLAMLALAFAWDWSPDIPPLPGETVAQVRAQQPAPPNQWHPYRGGTNCVQVADVNGNFSCSPLVTINPTTGAFNSVLGGPISQAVALVVAPAGNTLQALGNDLVIGQSSGTIAPAGPGSGAATLRVRPSPLIPGFCRLVVAGGKNYGQEYAVAFYNPASPAANVPNSGYLFADYYAVDFPC